MPDQKDTTTAQANQSTAVPSAAIAAKPASPTGGQDFVLEPDGQYAAFCLFDGHLFQPMRWKTKKGFPAGNFVAVYDSDGQPILAAICKKHRAVFNPDRLLVFLRPREHVERALNNAEKRFDAPRFQIKDVEPSKKEKEKKKAAAKTPATPRTTQQ